MSELQKLQFRFAVLTAMLLQEIIGRGYQFTWGDAFRDPRATFPYSHKASLHNCRLAIDLQIFRNGVWLRKGEDFEDLGIYWESIGGSWGGRFDDGGHFSLAYNGMR